MVKPFLKWAGGKRWLTDCPSFELPDFQGTYFEPFLGGGAVFFNARPHTAVLSDLNPRLIETYEAVRDHADALCALLEEHHRNHSKPYYYQVRSLKLATPVQRAAQFLYLNRTCWNGLYRENLRGEFNVPIGTKSKVFDPDEDLHAISDRLKGAKLLVSDFEATMSMAGEGDLVFADPPYTTAHNFNGFVKYNETVFAWSDQVRLKEAAVAAKARGAAVIITNAYHSSILELYAGAGKVSELRRQSVISGKAEGRAKTSECLISI